VSGASPYRPAAARRSGVSFPYGQVFSSVGSVMNVSITAYVHRSSSPASENSMVVRRKIVAVVDDDPSVLGATEDLLNAYGFATKVFASAEEFLDRGTATQVDCLLLDAGLGGMSGIELQRRLKASGSGLPVIFMTGLDDETLRAQALKAGCFAYFRKPFLGNQLIDAIEKASTRQQRPC
jgi:FixJ family two-component response regulator